MVYMVNISRLRAVLIHDATRGAWTEPLAVIYWPYTTKPSGALMVTNVIRAIKMYILSYQSVYHGYQPIRRA